MVFSAAMLAATVVLFMRIPKGFLPSEDRSQIMGSTEAAEGISYKSMFEHQQAVAAVLQAKTRDRVLHVQRRGSRQLGRQQRQPDDPPETQVRAAVSAPTSWSSSGGPASTPFPASASSCRTRPRSPSAAAWPGASTSSPCRAPTPTELYKYAVLMEEKIRDLPGFQDVTSDLRMKNPQVNVEIQRDKASASGITAAQIETALYNAYGSRQVSTILAPNNQYYVVMELQDQYQLDPSALSMLYVRSSTGPLVPLNAVADLSTGVGPLTINHQGQLPSVTVSFNLAPGVSLGEAVSAVNKLGQDMLPATITTSFQGTAQAFQSSMQGTGLAARPGHPGHLPGAGHPVRELHPSDHDPLGPALRGLRRAAHADDLRRRALDLRLRRHHHARRPGQEERDHDGRLRHSRPSGPRARTRTTPSWRPASSAFRPIMMTTMAALMGGLPIALGLGAGAESRRPLGLAVVGGLLFSQTLTLYVTPVFYLYMEGLRSSWTRNLAGKGTGSV